MGTRRGPPENVTQEAAAAKSGQEGLVVVIEDSVAPTSEAVAGAKPLDVQSVQVTGDVESQGSTEGADARQEKVEKGAEVASGLGGPVVPSAAEAATVVALSHASD